MNDYNLKNTKSRAMMIIALLFFTFLFCGCKGEVERVGEESGSASGVASAEVSGDITDASADTAEDGSYSFTIAVAGDINFDENWGTMQYYNEQENGIYDCVDQTLLDQMNAADIMLINNEFSYSTNGSPMDGKYYTFRANPDRVEILKQMGVDIVTLANNHVYDYGEQAFEDTLTTLDETEIKHVGAGNNLEEAMEPVYYEVDGKTVAFVAASRAEKNVLTPEAGEDTSGILYCYDPTLLCEEIAEAKEHSDFVIAYVHWGTEYSNDFDSTQETTGQQYLDAGADVVIGAHPHCLQGIEYYNGKPIVYSLGNFWFNEKRLYTTLLKLNISGNAQDSQIEVQLVPALQSDYQTTYLSDPEQQTQFYDFMKNISVGISIDENGVVTESSN